MNSLMDHPFPKSTAVTEKLKRLQVTVTARDIVAILIDADPDSMASALALKRLLWRKVKQVLIYRINRIKRTDNLAFVRLLDIDQKHIREIKRSKITKWAVLDGQPNHREKFKDYKFDIIIDHHPVLPTSKGRFVDVRESYGATSTIMTEYLRGAKIKPSTRLATALFYGIKTDTHNFVKECIPNDINAFRYVYQFTNMNIIRKIESSEITRRILSKIRIAMDRLTFLDGIAFVHMDKVDNPDILVILADFFMKLAEVRWSIVSGVYGKDLVVILRNASLQGDAGKTAQKLFGGWGGTVGGHMGAARAEIPMAKISSKVKGGAVLSRFLRTQLKVLKQMA